MRSYRFKAPNDAFGRSVEGNIHPDSVGQWGLHTTVLAEDGLSVVRHDYLAAPDETKALGVARLLGWELRL